MESNSYLDKIRKAENSALGMIKIESIKKGGDSVYNLRINITEATSGHGMIMISVSGSAVNTGRDMRELEELIKIIEHSKHEK